MVIQSQIGNDITVCLDTFELVITLDNPSPFLLEDINCEVRLPSGFVYIPGSVTGGAESNISVQNKPIFSMADMPTLTYNKQLTLKGYATCNFIGQYAQGFALSDTVLVSYTKGGSPDQEPLHFTPSFFVRIPSLNISTITPQSFNANSTPDTFQRCIVITNTGDGSLRSFDFTEDHGTSIDVLSFDIGNWNSSGTLESLYLSGVDFSAFGNGDVLFDPGESITICQDVAITDCQSLYSDYEAFWGCHSQICEVANQNANVVFPNITPNIQITAYDTVKTCYGHTLPNEQRLVITNTGLGKAKDIELYIMMSWSTGVQNGIQSYFDAASFSLKDMNGANINFVQTDSTFSSVPCVPFGQPSSVMIRIDSLNSGDSLELTWEILNCCLNTLNGWRDIAAWSYTATYFNECGNDFIVPLSQGTPRTHVGTTISVNNTPGSIISGQNYMFDFLLDSYSNSFPKGNGFHWKYVFDLSPCVSLVGNNVSILSEDLVQTWNPSSVTVNGNQVIALFNGNPPFSLNKALLNIELTPNCGACASNSANISVSSFYISDLSCNCEVAVNTASLQTNIVCPQYNCLGMTNFPFQVQRTSYGSPDNDNDGLADAGGTLNFSKIRTDRVTLGDTITSIFKGKVNTSPPFIPNFNYCYAEAIIDNGAYFSGVSSVLEIYRGGNLLAVCNNLNLTSSNVVSTNKTRFVYDATASVLAASNPSLPAGFVYQKNDSLVLTVEHKVTDIPGNGALQQCLIESEFYMSNVANPSQGQKIFCNSYQGSVSILGYYFISASASNVTISSCETKSLYENYYLSIGPCCNNYAGGNLFPFEYRHWATLDTAEVIVPPGFEFMNAELIEYRTAGTNTNANSGWIQINPINPFSDTLKFIVKDLYVPNGGPIEPSDDGFYGSLKVDLRPTCQAVSGVARDIHYKWTMNTTDAWNNSPIDSIVENNDKDILTYKGPKIFLQSVLPNKIATDSISHWDMLLSNVSNVDANNTWITAPKVSGIEVIKAYDLDNNVTIPIVNGFYPIGTISALATRNIRLFGIFTHCYEDSIIAYAGWNCNGYPDSLSAYPCPTEQQKLKLTPQLPNLFTSISATTPVDLCDVIDITIDIENIQNGTAKDVKVLLQLPLGMDLISGSTNLQYPLLLPNFSINDPQYISGTRYEWSLSDFSSILNNNGLKGFVNPDSNKIQLTFQATTTCDFISGSNVRATTYGRSICGTETPKNFTGSNPIFINGITIPYETSFDLSTTYISPCSDSTTMSITIYNDGPNPFGPNDSVTFVIPDGVYYVSNSTQNIENFHTNDPSEFGFNGSTYLTWQMNSGVASGDSITYSFDFSGVPSDLSCGITEFEIFTTNSASSTCLSSGIPCDIKVMNGDSALSIYVYKADLEIQAGTAVSIPNPPNGELVTVNLDVKNYGQTINAGNETYFTYYYDDGNSILDSNDTYLYTDTVFDRLDSGLVYSYVGQIPVPAGNSCNLHVVIDSTINSCLCESSNSFFFPLIEMEDAAIEDTIVCGASPLDIGQPQVGTYTYMWSPATHLSSTNVANPTMIYTGSTIDTISYEVVVNRLNCASKDTVEIIMSPANSADAGIDTNLCDLGTYILSGSAPVGVSNGEWQQLSGPSNLSFVDPSDHTTTISGLIEGTYQLEWNVFNTHCDTAKDTVTINVYSQPVADAGIDSTLCNSNSLNLYANTLVGLASGIWQQISGPSNAIIASPTLETTSITGLNKGQYGFLWVVSNGTCVSDSDTISLSILPTPIAQLGSDIQLCDSTEVTLTNLVPKEIGYTYAWTQLLGPSTANILAPADTSTLVQGLLRGQYQFQFSVSNLICGDSLDTINVVIDSTELAQAGLDEQICGGDSAIFTGIQPVFASGLWNQISGIPANIANTDSANSVVNGMVEGSYEFEWTVTSGVCPIQKDTVSIVLYDIPIADAGIHDTICENQQLFLSGNSPAGTAAGSWSLIQGSGLNIFNNTDPNTAISNIQPGSYTFEWRVSNGVCTDSIDTVSVSINALNFSSVMNDTSICDSTSLVILGQGKSKEDWGTWSLLSASSAVITDPDSFATEITGLLPGTYDLEWSVFDSVCPADADTLQITVFNTSQAIVSNDTAYCGKALIEVHAQAVTNPSQGSWSILGAIGNVVDPDSTTSQINGLSEGIYNLIWTVNNGTCPATCDTVEITVHDEPIAEILNDSIVRCEASSIDIQATQVLGNAIGTWSIISGNGGVINDVNNAATSLSALNNGDYHLNWIVSNGTCPSDTAIISIYNYANPTAAFAYDTNAVCLGGCIEFRSLSQSNHPIINTVWNIGPQQINGDSTYTHCFDQQGLYNVNVIAISDKGCSDTSSAQIVEALETPEANFTYTPENPSMKIPKVTTNNLSFSANSFEWIVTDTLGETIVLDTMETISYEFMADGHYNIQLKAINGICWDTISKSVYVEPKESIYIPNSFTPNGDGINETFGPITLGILEIEFQVFNRWGDLVFQSSEVGENWDGSMMNTGKPCELGTYNYKILARDLNKAWKRYYGPVNLIR